MRENEMGQHMLREPARKEKQKQAARKAKVSGRNVHSRPVSWWVASLTFPKVPCPRVLVTMYGPTRLPMAAGVFYAAPRAVVLRVGPLPSPLSWTACSAGFTRARRGLGKKELGCGGAATAEVCKRLSEAAGLLSEETVVSAGPPSVRTTYS